jgi:hypothetical protein
MGQVFAMYPVSYFGPWTPAFAGGFGSLGWFWLVKRHGAFPSAILSRRGDLVV